METSIEEGMRIVLDYEIWSIIFRIVGAIVVFDLLKFCFKWIISWRFGLDLVDNKGKDQLDLVGSMQKNFEKMCDVINKVASEITEISKDIAIIKDRLK